MPTDNSTLLPPLDSSAEDCVPPMILLSQKSFERNLETLLSGHKGKWAAYHGSDFLGVASTETELYRRCLSLGLNREEFVVRGIEPKIEDGDTTFGFSS